MVHISNTSTHGDEDNLPLLFIFSGDLLTTESSCFFFRISGEIWSRRNAITQRHQTFIYSFCLHQFCLCVMQSRYDLASLAAVVSELSRLALFPPPASDPSVDWISLSQSIKTAVMLCIRSEVLDFQMGSIFSLKGFLKEVVLVSLWGPPMSSVELILYRLVTTAVRKMNFTHIQSWKWCCSSMRSSPKFILVTEQVLALYRAPFHDRRGKLPNSQMLKRNRKHWSEAHRSDSGSHHDGLSYQVY